MSKRKDIYKLIDEHIENEFVACHIKEYIANQANTQKDIHDKLTKRKKRRFLNWKKNY